MAGNDFADSAVVGGDAAAEEEGEEERVDAHQFQRAHEDFRNLDNNADEKDGDGGSYDHFHAATAGNNNSFFCGGPPNNNFAPPPPPMADQHSAMMMCAGDEQQLDFTRQYYEARMREHAMQYANAAAGAAWAAARMANYSYHGNNTAPVTGMYPPYHFGCQQVIPDFHHPIMQYQQQYPPHCKLWEPPSSPPTSANEANKERVNKNKLKKKMKQPQSSSHYNHRHYRDDNNTDNNTDSDTDEEVDEIVNNYSRHSQQQHQQQHSFENKKRLSKNRCESGNDSISSLGSESYHQQQQQQQQQQQKQRSRQQLLPSSSNARNNYQNNITMKEKKKKKNQRRHYFNYEDDRGGDQQFVATTTITTATSALATTSSASTPSATATATTKSANEINNHRQKRGLQQQHQQHDQYSSKSSFSSSMIGIGYGGGGGGSSNISNRKKKNRSSSTPTALPPRSSSSSNTNNIHHHQGVVFLGGLIGKTGVSALHELCHKYHWEKPVYTLIENNVGGASVAVAAAAAATTTATASTTANTNDGSDGSRDVVSSGQEGGGVGNNDTNNSGTSSSNNNNNGSSRINYNNHYQVHGHEFVLAVHVNKIELGRGRGDSKTAAKQDGSRKALAALVPGVVFDPNGILLDVGGGGGGRGRGEQGRVGGGGVITSIMEELGPHLASQLAIGGGGIRSSRPSSPDHSETSSISTSVSMTKMAHIGGGSGSGGVSSHDYAPREGVISGGPVGLTGRYYSNIYPCASTTSGVSSVSEVEDGDENAYYASRGASVCSTLLQAMWQIDDRIRQPPSYSFDVYPIPSSKESAGGTEQQPNKRRKSGGPSSELPKPAHRGTFQCTATLNLYFPIEEGKDYSYSSIMESWESPLEYLQSKDQKFSSSYGNILSSQESRKRKDSQATPSPLKSDGNDEQDNVASKRQKRDECVKHTLECIATGSTKRESKHKASAKILTLLFPECTSLVEVKAAAEAARECYAASKAMSSQTKRAKLSDKGSSPENRGKRPGNLLAKSESFVSVAGLSLSEEPGDESKRIKWFDSTKSEAITEFDVRFDCEVDTALKCLRDQEEEPSDDVGRIVLCRAQPDDADFIHSILNKATESTRCGDNSTAHVDSGESGINFLKDNDCIFLLLSRAVASVEPLGCAILTFMSSSTGGGRLLSLRHIGHEEHLPRERFMECLEAFASKLETNLDTRGIFNVIRLISTDEIRQCLSRSKKSNSDCSYPAYQDEEVISMKGNSSHSLLQSVKEEDSEDADDGSEGDIEKEADGSHDPEPSGKRQLRSKRRREINDQHKH